MTKSESVPPKPPAAASSETAHQYSAHRVLSDRGLAEGLQTGSLADLRVEFTIISSLKSKPTLPSLSSSVYNPLPATPAYKLTVSRHAAEVKLFTTDIFMIVSGLVE